MTDSKYGDVLLNLRHTGLDAMRSYYANSFNAPHEKHRADHIPHIKALYDKNRDDIDNLTSPKNISGKYECGYSYPPSHIKDPRCNSNPYYVRVPFRHSDVKLNPKTGDCCPPNRVPVTGDQVPSSPHRSTYNKHSQYIPNHPYCKRNNTTSPHLTSPHLTSPHLTSPHLTSPHLTSPERIHSDQRQYLDTQARFKQSPYRNDNENYRNGHSPYQQQTLVEKSHTDNQHVRYENYRSLATPCTLPCCYNLKADDTRRHYERRETSPQMHSPSSTKNVDYQGQGVISRETGESSAFSPIRPSHIRRVHSTESGYSSESNGTCHSANSFKELEVCNKTCCTMGNHDSPTIHHKMPREFSTEHRQHATGNERKINANEHRDFVGSTVAHEARFASTHRLKEHENLRFTLNEHQAYENERRLHTFYKDNDENESGCKERGETRSDINLNDDFRQRRISGSHYHENVKDLWGEFRDKHREQFHADNPHRVPSTTDENKQQRVKSEHAHWNPGMGFDPNSFDPRRGPLKPSIANLGECDDASRTAMKAFDAHIRKMIANSRDINSINYLTKFHHSINQTAHPFNYPNGVRRSLSLSSEPVDTRTRSNNEKQGRRCLSTSSEPHDTKTSPTSDSKHSVSQILGEKQAASEKNDTILNESVKEEAPSSMEAEEEKKTFIELVNEKEAEPCEEKNSCETKIEEETEAIQSCDSTEKNKTDCTDEEHNDKTSTNSIEGDEKKMLPGEDEAPSPEVQCSAVDSTLGDDLAASPQRLGGLLGLTRVANEHLGQALAKEKKRSKNNNCLHLWQFLRRMLDQEQDKVGRCIEWTNREIGEFRLIKTAVIAELWGQSKNRTCMTYEKMARAMRYYYKMNILEKVPHKRLHFRFGERILSKVLHPSNSKLYMGKTKMYEEIYRLNERTMNASFPNPMLNPNDNLVKDFRNGQHLNYLNMQVERSKDSISYLPNDIPGLTLPPYYNEHVNNHLRNTLPHITSTRINNVVPPLELIQQKNEVDMFPNTLQEKTIANSANTSPGSNPSVSPYSRTPETPETWSDVDSNDELIVDTDTE